MKGEADQIICTLFRECAESLYRYAARLTRSPDLADDLVQEAFMSLYQELRRGRTMTNPRAWMLGLISNKAMQIFRDLRRWKADESAIHLLPAPEAKPDPRWDVSGDALMPLLETLSVREAEVVLLRLQSRKYREIAERLGISDKSVATLLARALAKMKQGARQHRANRDGLEDWSHDDAMLQ